MDAVFAANTGWPYPPLEGYAGGMSNGAFPAWNQPATRDWFSRALYQALGSYFGIDRVP